MERMRRVLSGAVRRTFVWSTVLICLASSSVSAQQPEQSLEEAREAFLQMLEGARMEGKFSVVGPSGMMEQDDLYAVSTLRPGDGDIWYFEYQMSYRDNMDVPPLEIPVRVVFHDGTPMITMTDQEVPGLGKFSVRLIFHGDQYAGMWSSPMAGGHMWGVVKRDGEGDAADP